ncbi:MAG: hypothetical protein LBU45_05380 [Azoarcus sp.]|jgi:hypothetical protein|nr:hypothetical protein [Azoarcus sp.]
MNPAPEHKPPRDLASQKIEELMAFSRSTSAKDIDGICAFFAWLTARKETEDLMARLMRASKPV